MMTKKRESTSARDSAPRRHSPSLRLSVLNYRPHWREKRVKSNMDPLPGHDVDPECALTLRVFHIGRSLIEKAPGAREARGDIAQNGLQFCGFITSAVHQAVNQDEEFTITNSKLDLARFPIRRQPKGVCRGVGVSYVGEGVEVGRWPWWSQVRVTEWGKSGAVAFSSTSLPAGDATASQEFGRTPEQQRQASLRSPHRQLPVNTPKGSRTE